MELSILLTDEIRIEEERWKLHNQGLSWKEIQSELNAKYRESSKKRLFRCRCCNSTTFLVLSEEKACFFKHESKEECAGSRNYIRYKSNTDTNEHPKHRIGVAILKDQLQANLSHHGAVVKEGYLSRVDLKYVPDLLVEWPTGETWTFDYVTGTKSEQYQRYLNNKQMLYLDKGYKSYFFFDASQIARHPDQEALALNVGEKGALRFLMQEPTREKLLRDIHERLGPDCLVRDQRLMLTDMHVYQLMYVNDEFEGKLFYISQLQLKPNQSIREIPNRWYQLIGEEHLISLDVLFSYHAGIRSLVWEQGILSDEEYIHISSSFEERYQEQLRVARMKEEERKRNAELAKRREQEEQRFSEERRAVPEDRRDYVSTKGGEPKEQTRKQQVEEYMSIVDRMKRSSMLITSPGFQDRICECEEDFRIYNETGVLPDRIFAIVRMMKNALGI